ncbi:unnamed protein product [Blepharisma stoltei]|uniref:CTP synthase n=1 Tax=Blepharisma stoltei TaxID=1481888 RepID=A0AAU9IKD7_9CILI|nr:unnamed protein product [Blepharisma stoltei]
MKYLVICGGTVSGIGKGTIVSSIGVILKACGYKLTAIKIDPYLNIDAGTMSPYEHGEVFVLDDGGEVDLDLGNYERFLNLTLTWDHNITTGKIYKNIIEKERRGDYLGKTVQVVPHVTDEIQNWIFRVSQQPIFDRDTNEESKPDICLVEVGGTVGDIEGATYFEALRQLILKVGLENVCLIFTSFVPYLRGSGELKTKPTQHGNKELRSLGLIADMIVCRSEVPLDMATKEKIALFTNARPDRVFCCEDVNTVYKVPVQLESQGISKQICDKLNIEWRVPNLSRYISYVSLWERLKEDNTTVTIVIVGKYTESQDAYMSLVKALFHAAMACKRKLNLTWVESENLENPEHPDWEKVYQSQGVLVAGGFGGRGAEGKILTVKYARENKKPMLGICLGMQMAVIEYARNVLGLSANSTEVDEHTENPVIIDMPDFDKENKGHTMRLGSKPTSLTQDSLAYRLYNGSSVVWERHRHRFEVNPQYITRFEEAGLIFSGKDPTNTRMEVVELSQQTHPFFLGTQYHPEFKTSPFTPSPIYYGFILAAINLLPSGLIDSRHIEFN